MPGLSDASKPIKFCAYGALERYVWVTRNRKEPEWNFRAYHVMGRVREIVRKYFRPANLTDKDHWRITEVNDNGTHKDVMKLFSDAARRAKQAEKGINEDSA